MKSLYTRREAIKIGGCSAIGLLVPLPVFSNGTVVEMKTRKIPVSGEELPVVGLGTWQSFDVGNSTADRTRLKEVLNKMNTLGGTFIDSSPMYGSSERVVGDLTANSPFGDQFFFATKVWTRGKDAGVEQMRRSFNYMQRKTMDLMQIHNLVDWKTHSNTLRNMKEAGEIRYWGITHYLDSAHNKLVEIIKQERPDFVQFNYSIRSRNAERELLETAANYNTATVINRPFEGGSLFKWARGRQIPDWCGEFGIESWAQFFLKFILSHDAVNCVIPGTSKPHHLVDNMKTGFGKLPDIRTRNKMAELLNSR